MDKEKPNVTDDEKLFDFLTHSLTEIIDAYKNQTCIMLGIIDRQKHELHRLFPDRYDDHRFCDHTKQH